MKKIIGVAAVLLMIGFAGCKKENSCGCEEAFKSTDINVNYTGSAFGSGKHIFLVRSFVTRALFQPSHDIYHDTIFPILNLTIDTSGGNERYFNKPINVTYKVFDGSNLLFSHTDTLNQFTYYPNSDSTIAYISYHNRSSGWNGGSSNDGHYRVVTDIDFFDNNKCEIQDLICLVRNKCCDSKSFYQNSQYINGYDWDGFYNGYYRTDLCQ